MDAASDTTPHPTATLDTADRTTRAAAGTPGQLRLLDAPERRDWTLDESTREVGRRGIRLARQALEDARRRDAERAVAEHARSAHPGTSAA